MNALAKTAEMGINRQTVNKNSNEMAKGPFLQWRCWRLLASHFEYSLHSRYRWRKSPISPQLPERFSPLSPALWPKWPVSKRPLLASNSNRQRLAIFRYCMHFWTWVWKFVMIMFWHQDYHGSIMTPLRFLLAFVFLGTRSFFQKSLEGTWTFPSCLGCGKVWTNSMGAFWKYSKTKF